MQSRFPLKQIAILFPDVFKNCMSGQDYSKHFCRTIFSSMINLKPRGASVTSLGKALTRTQKPMTTVAVRGGRTEHTVSGAMPTCIPTLQFT